MEFIEPNSERWLSLEDLPNEIWKDIKGYEGLYQISSYGRVKSIAHFVNTGIKHSTKRKTKSCICKIEFKSSGSPYCRIQLRKNHKYKHLNIHTIVAKEFIPMNDFKYHERDNLKLITYEILEINHKDENIKNNCVNNLEWCTHLYNMNYGTRTQRATESRNKTIERRNKDVKNLEILG